MKDSRKRRRRRGRRLTPKLKLLTILRRPRGSCTSERPVAELDDLYFPQPESARDAWA